LTQKEEKEKSEFHEKGKWDSFDLTGCGLTGVFLACVDSTGANLAYAALQQVSIEHMLLQQVLIKQMLLQYVLI